jgi:hypothetical protein
MGDCASSFQNKLDPESAQLEAGRFERVREVPVSLDERKRKAFCLRSFVKYIAFLLGVTKLMYTYS